MGNLLSFMLGVSVGAAEAKTPKDGKNILESFVDWFYRQPPLFTRSSTQDRLEEVVESMQDSLKELEK